MLYKQVSEGAIKLFVPKAKTIYDADVFYNPNMITNRDISILLLKSLNRKLSCLDLLAASGARGLRIKKEVKNSQVDLNDKNPKAYKLIKKNASYNKLKVKVSNLNAEFRLANYKQVYNYIDIDPFGTPGPFLDSAIKALKWKNGILGVTATDTSALAGSYPSACKRKYGSIPLKNHLMHETGIRILIKKVQEIAAQYEVALTPIFCHSTLHYMRVYFKSDLGAKKTDEILKQIGMYENSGPMWLGNLYDFKLIDKMIKQLSKTKICFDTIKLMYLISQEAKIKTFGFYDIHKLAKQFKLKSIPKFDLIIEKLKKKGYKASRTHFSDKGIKTNADIKIIKNILR